MTPYRNLSRSSGITAYRIDGSAIVVEFEDGGLYRYDTTRPGRSFVQEMQRLAVLGRGLGTYINQHVRERYAERLR